MQWEGKKSKLHGVPLMGIEQKMKEIGEGLEICRVNAPFSPPPR